MTPASRTNTALLEALFDADSHQAWQELDTRLRGVLVGLARQVGLNEHDAADVAQETLLQFFRDYQARKYDRARGRLRSWILGIARHRIHDLLRLRAGRRENRGDSALLELPGEEELGSVWDAECRRAVLERALAELRTETRLDEKTIRAFERCALQQRPPAEVAADLELSVDSVYTAKNRCLSHLRVILARFNALYEIT